jgi:hypothetical protein
MWSSGIQRALMFLTVAISIAARADTPPSNSLRHESERVLWRVDALIEQLSKASRSPP